MRRHNIPARIGSCILAIAWVVCGAQPQPIRGYIKDTWQTLTRSNRTIAAAALDPKFQPDRDGRWPVYILPGEDLVPSIFPLKTFLAGPGLDQRSVHTEVLIR